MSIRLVYFSGTIASKHFCSIHLYIVDLEEHYIISKELVFLFFLNILNWLKINEKGSHNSSSTNYHLGALDNTIASCFPTEDYTDTISVI